jgi:hypothetical protein
VPPSTSGLAQQLSAPLPPGPHVVVPFALAWQLAGWPQTPPEQFGVAGSHATTLPHWPHVSHACTPLSSQSLAPCAHAGGDAHEQAPHPQLTLHDCVP